MYQVYVLQNKSGRRYIGISVNPQARLLGHNAGISRWTNGRGPWTIVWTSKPLSLSDARKFENKLKRQKGGSGLKTLTGL
jgi:putative endonuclease